MIKTYLQFINEDHKHNYGCVMLNLNIPNWDNITSNIDEEDLYIDPNDDSYGLEDNPHVTVLYGLHQDIDEKVVSIINKYKYKNYNFKITGVDAFKNENYDVLKFSVQVDESLKDFNNELSDLPNSNEYPDYKPHITIAYLKPGMADKYINMGIEIPDLSIKSIIYSKSNGQELIYQIY